MNTQVQPKIDEIKIPDGKMDPEWKRVFLNFLRNPVGWKPQHLVWVHPNVDKCGCAVGGLIGCMTNLNRKDFNERYNKTPKFGVQSVYDFLTDEISASGLSPRQIQSISNIYEGLADIDGNPFQDGFREIDHKANEPCTGCFERVAQYVEKHL